MKATFLLLIALLSFTLSVTYAQKADMPKDTIYWRTEKLDMLIQIRDYHLLTKDDQLIKLLQDFQTRMEEIDESLPVTSSYKINYTYQKQIEVLETDKIKSFTLREDKGWSEDFQHLAVVNDANYQVRICFNDIAKVIATDFSGIVADITAQLPHRDRHLRYMEFHNENNKATLTENRPSGYLDMLSLQAGVGASVYRNQFLTDITGEIGLQLNHKGILRNQFYVSNNLIFSFDAENTALINNFTNFGYRRNLSNQKDKPNWLGIEIGTLTKRSGDLFQPNTMRLGMNWGAGKNITVAPQLYFNGFFQQVSPGLRIGIGL